MILITETIGIGCCLKLLKAQTIVDCTNGHHLLSCEFALTFLIALIALWTALRSSRSSRATAIISILQDSQIREARKEVFRKHTSLSFYEINNPESDYRNKIELVCQSFDSVYRIYDANETGCFFKRKCNLVYKILITSYWRSIIICYLKSYPIIISRRKSQNHPELWKGFEELFIIACKTKKINLNDYLIKILKENGITDSYEVFIKNCPIEFKEVSGIEKDLLKLYELLLEKLDNYIFNKGPQ